MHITQLSVFDRLTGKRYPVELPKGNDIFNFGSFGELTEEVVGKNRRLAESDDRPPANTLALLCAEIEQERLREIAKSYGDDGERNEANDVLNPVMSQLKLKG